jgi:hypothetical protein
VAHVAHLAGLVDINIQEGAARAQGERRLRPPFEVALDERPQRKIGDHIPVVAEDNLVIPKQVLDVLQAPRRVEEDRLMAENDRHAAPRPFGKGLGVSFGAMVGVDDEAGDSRSEEVVHRVGDDGPSGQRKKRLRHLLGERPEPCPETRPENERRTESPLFQ